MNEGTTWRHVYKQIVIEEDQWEFVHERPDQIQEIITNREEAVDSYTRTIRLINLVEWAAYVDYHKTGDYEPFIRTRKLKYGERATTALVELLESSSDSLEILTYYLKDCWDHRLPITTDALLLLFTKIEPRKALPETVTSFIEVMKAMNAGGKCVSRAGTEVLAHFWNTRQSRGDVERYLLERLDNRQCSQWTLAVLAKTEMKVPSARLVRRVRHLSWPTILHPRIPGTQWRAKHLLEVWGRRR